MKEKITIRENGITVRLSAALVRELINDFENKTNGLEDCASKGKRANHQKNKKRMIFLKHKLQGY